MHLYHLLWLYPHTIFLSLSVYFGAIAFAFDDKHLILL